MSANTDRLIAIMARLRDPDGGCPWDIEQTHRSIAPHTIEEAYEVVDAIEGDDPAALRDELGDLLFHVVYHARLAEEAGRFAYEDVAAAVCDKMVRRHPHVFGEEAVEGARAQTAAWEATKARERAAKAAAENGAPPSAVDGVIPALPALTRAYKIQNRAARVGFDWGEAAGVLDKIREETAEVEDAMAATGAPEALAEEIGDLLFSCVNLSRKLGIEPETALRLGTRKFEDRFRRMEAVMAERGLVFGQATLADLDDCWNEAKRRPRG